MRTPARPMSADSIGRAGGSGVPPPCSRLSVPTLPYRFMPSSPPPQPAPTQVPPRSFRDLLRHGRYTFTERELMEHLRMTYRTIKQREADPSTLTIAELLRVADLLNEPVQDIIAVVLAEVQAPAAGLPAGTSRT